MKFKEIYSFNALDEIKAGELVYVVDRREKEVIFVNAMTVSNLCRLLESTEKGRYVFWKEEEEEI
jgi:hypothetical protein